MLSRFISEIKMEQAHKMSLLGRLWPLADVPSLDWQPSWRALGETLIKCITYLRGRNPRQSFPCTWELTGGGGGGGDVCKRLLALVEHLYTKSPTSGKKDPRGQGRDNISLMEKQIPWLVGPLPLNLSRPRRLLSHENIHKQTRDCVVHFLLVYCYTRLSVGMIDTKITKVNQIRS